MTMFENLKSKKVTIMGLGSYREGSGILAASFFASSGAKVTVTDLRKKEELKSQIKKLKTFKNIEYVLGRHRKDDFKCKDFIFKNPSVPKDSPYLKIARKNKIPIINDWIIFLEKYPDNLLVGITGTKGKSTITTLIYEILKRSDSDVILCGNIGKSPLAFLGKIRKDTIIVAELSSWALQEFEGIKKSPHISVVTNLMPDHLDKYKNVREYYKDKENIFRFQKSDDYLVLNRELTSWAKKAKARKILFSQKKKYSSAVEVAKILGIPKNVSEKSIKSFRGVPHRLEFVGIKKGVKYINDSAATMPDAVVYALDSLKERKGGIILIAGGVDKKLDYKEMVNAININVKELILLPGTATDKIKKYLSKIVHPIGYTIEYSTSMKEAVSKAKKIAKRGDIVLLSPGAASFNMFKNEFDRGGQFVKLVKKL